MEQGTHTELMRLEGAYHALVQTQEEGQVEVEEEKDKAEAEQDEQNNNDKMLRDELQQQLDDETRSSFLTPTRRMRSLTVSHMSSRSEARLSRYEKGTIFIYTSYSKNNHGTKKTGHRFKANYMTNFDIDIIISNVIANYEKKSSI